MKPNFQLFVFRPSLCISAVLIGVTLLTASACTSASSRYKKEAGIIEERYPYALTFPTPYAPKNNFNIILPTGERRRVVLNGETIVRDEIR